MRHEPVRLRIIFFGEWTRNPNHRSNKDQRIMGKRQPLRPCTIMRPNCIDERPDRVPCPIKDANGIERVDGILRNASKMYESECRYGGCRSERNPVRPYRRIEKSWMKIGWTVDPNSAKTTCTPGKAVQCTLSW